MNKAFRKIIEQEKEDITTIKKLFKGERIKPRFDIKKLNILDVIANNWLYLIILLAFLLSGFFLGAVSFENVCNKALLECQDDCNSALGNTINYSVFPLYNVSPKLPVLPGITNQEE